MYPLCWPIDKASRCGQRLSASPPSLTFPPSLTVCPQTSLCVGQLYLRANDKSVKKIRKNGEKKKKNEKKKEEKKRRQKFLRPFFINGGGGDGGGDWSRRRQQTQGYVASQGCHGNAANASLYVSDSGVGSHICSYSALLCLSRTLP